MNELLMLALALVAGLALGAFFFWRPLVDGAHGYFVQMVGALVFGQQVAADGPRPRRVLFCRARGLEADGRLPARVCRRAIHRAAANPRTNRESFFHSQGRPPCVLVPTN